MKTLATHETYDRHNATSSGYDVEIRDNGTMRLTHRTRWQGSRTGQVYIVPTPPEITAALNPGDEDADLETAMTTWLQTQTPDDWRMIRSGHILR